MGEAYFGILIIMDTMTFDRDELYWSQRESHWLLGSKIGEVMSRDRYVQIKPFKFVNLVISANTLSL
jgi:hypothetical protein